jgi:hypothetical protein
LQGNQEVAESTTQSGRKHEKYHDGTVHGHQLKVKVRVQLTGSILLYHDPLAKQGLKERKVHTGKAQLKTEQNRQETANQRPNQTGYQELLGNHLVVLRKNVFRQERFFVMLMLMGMHIVCVCHSHISTFYWFST